jgi:hypothetical protein
VKKIKILLTFDYELPLGYSIDYEKGLFAPAESLLERASKVAVPVVLFADVCSAIRFKEWDYERYYKPFVGQLQRALSKGHDVQLHIHPHWMTSGFTDGAFRPSLDFSLSEFAVAKNGFTIENIIERAFHHLSEICTSVYPDYRCVAYRAGGYDIGSESSRILHKLYELGVRIDSSVIKGYFLEYGFSKVDYSGSPATSTWKVSLDGAMTKAADQGLLELPVTSEPVSLSSLAARRLRKLTQGAELRSRAYAHGGKGFLQQQGGQTMMSQFRKALNPVVLSFDREHLDHEDLAAIVDYNVGKYRREERDLVVTAIGHPKSMGKYHLDVFEQFVEKMRQRFGQQVSFVTYRDILSS